MSKRKYTFLDKRLSLSFPAQMCHCTMPKADAGWSGLAAQCQYLGNSILQSAGVKKPWGSHSQWTPFSEVPLQVLSSLLLLLSPLWFLFQTGIAQKMTILFRSARLIPQTGSLNPSLLIVCTLKANVSQGRDWCLALAQNVEQTADWFLTNSFKRRKANSVFNVSLL